MAAIPKKVQDRIKTNLKKYQKVLESAKARDINESDTVRIVSDMLCDLFGFDRYLEISTEYLIRGTYCDLVVKSGDTIHFLMEVKAIGLDLKESHLRQVVDYAAKQGVEWAVLTNGIIWETYRILFKKPIGQEKIFEINMLEVSPRAEQDMEKIYVLSREGTHKAAISSLHEELQATNRFVIAAILQADDVLNTLRRELKKVSKVVRASKEDLLRILRNEVLKREVIEGEKAEAAKHKIKRGLKKPSKTAQIPTESKAVAKIEASPSESEANTKSMSED